MDPVDCRKCRHYQITWDRRYPYGCRVMKFKSAGLPAHDVIAASGTPCQFFEKKGVGSLPANGSA